MNLRARHAGVALALIVGLGGFGSGLWREAGRPARPAEVAASVADGHTGARSTSTAPGASSITAAPPRPAGRAGMSPALATRAPAPGEVAICGSAPMAESDLAGPCERLTPQAWLRADPGNAAPSLWLMSEARAAHQAQAADEALYRASQSRFHDARIAGLGRLLAHPALDPQAGLPAHLVAHWLVGVQAAYALPTYTGLMAQCAAPRMTDANRRLVCDDLARLMVGRSREVITVSIGYRLAERLQWDAPRLQAADDLRLALQSPALMPPSANDPTGLQSCAGLQDLRERVVAQAEIGERAYLEGRLGTLGLSASAVARSVRASRAAMAASASAAASAAKSTSP